MYRLGGCGRCQLALFQGAHAWVVLEPAYSGLGLTVLVRAQAGQHAAERRGGGGLDQARP